MNISTCTALVVYCVSNEYITWQSAWNVFYFYVLLIGMWLSLVEYYVRDVGAAGSNPVIPTSWGVVIGFQTITTPFLCHFSFCRICNIYALSCVDYDIYIRQFWQNGNFENANASIMYIEFLNVYIINLFSVIYLYFVNQFIQHLRR